MGFWAVDDFFFDYITKTFPEGSVMLELGSGTTTEKFSKLFTVHSIEHNKEWVGKFNSNYIHAPIKDYGDYEWYDRDEIAKNLPEKYDFILIDGPPSKYGRMGFYHNMDLFNTDVPLLVDDTNRKTEKNMTKMISDKLNIPYKMFKNGFSQCFCVVSKEFNEEEK